MVGTNGLDPNCNMKLMTVLRKINNLYFHFLVFRKLFLNHPILFVFLIKYLHSLYDGAVL